MVHSRGVASPIDKLELLRAAGRSERTPIHTLADLAEVVAILAADPEVPVDLEPLDSQSEQSYRRLNALGQSAWAPIHLEWSFGELQEFDQHWVGSPYIRFKMRFKDRLIQAGIAPGQAALMCGALDEMIGNAQSHSGSSTRALATFEVTQRWWIFSVTDFGIGIPERLRQNHDHAHLNDMDAISAALKHGVSTYRDPHRGVGFSQIFRPLADRKAKVRIRAGCGLVELTGIVGGTGALVLKPKPARQGTHVRAGAKIPALLTF